MHLTAPRRKLRLNLRLSEAERAMLTELAIRQGKSTSDAVRTALRRAYKEQLSSVSEER